MQLNLLPNLLLATSIIPITTALQSIYLGTLSTSAARSFIAFFSDSNPCADGTLFGFTPRGFADCDENLTILGHPNITFTGCKAVAGSPGTLPTGVADNGAPALKCKSKSNPPGSQYFANCPLTANSAIAGPVNLLEYCS